ncbi:AlpA family phage regulatory protein [Salmonella enterica subsp. enterica serovar Uganda]|nr:AlpA family phage regulatory protein [Salmonella enterica subsp. enterica serovar Uganda]
MQTKSTHRPTVLIDKKKLLEIIPFSERAIFNLEKQGAFPRRIALSSRKVVWDLTEILEWLDTRKKSGPAPRPGMGA